MLSIKMSDEKINELLSNFTVCSLWNIYNFFKNVEISLKNTHFDILLRNIIVKISEMKGQKYKSLPHSSKVGLKALGLVFRVS